MHLFYEGRVKSRALQLEIQKCAAARNALLNDLHIVEAFEVFPAKRGRHYASVGYVWRELESSYELCVPTPLVMSHYTWASCKEIGHGL